MFRGGIPDEYRVPLWQFLVRMRTHSARRFKKLGYYKRMLDYKDTSRTPFPQADQIGVDLQRTFPSNIHFQRKEQPLMQSLDRILRAFGWHNPRVGYCQGLGQVAGFALLILEEEDAFWALAAVVEDIMTWQYYCAPLLQAHLDVEVFLGMIEHYLPALHRHFASVQLQDNLFFLKWFMPVFVRILPAFVTFVIWDALLVEGREALFRFGLAILKLHEADLLKVKIDRLYDERDCAVCLTVTQNIHLTSACTHKHVQRMVSSNQTPIAASSQLCFDCLLPVYFPLPQ
eukprot:m.172599 g.172599  ORF g.172599 m.172599 type:complete len:287 (+) comp16519_c1_seq8:2143-3003(+)